MKKSKKKHFKPGTLGCHEAVHMVSFFAGSIDTELGSHPAIKRNPEWRAAVEHAVSVLGDLYQAMATEHFFAIELSKNDKHHA